MATARAFPAARRQTYAFLEDARRTCHVHLMADVDASRVMACRRSATRPTSFVSYVVKAAADAIAERPDAREVLSDGLWPRLVSGDGVHAKVLFDKMVDGQRCVVSGTIENADRETLAAIQGAIDEHKRSQVTVDGPFGKVRRLQQLPLSLVRVVYRTVLANPVRRARLQGNFSVTSVGHEPVRAIFPMIASPLGFGVGRIQDSAVVHDGQIAVAPTFTLSLAFDHRVLDGALASEVLADVKHRLENWVLS